MMKVTVIDIEDIDESDIECLTYELLRVIDEAVSNGISWDTAMLAVYDVLEALEEPPKCLH